MNSPVAAKLEKMTATVFSCGSEYDVTAYWQNDVFLGFDCAKPMHANAKRDARDYFNHLLDMYGDENVETATAEEVESLF